MAWYKQSQNQKMLFLDDDESRISLFFGLVPTVTIVRTAEEAIAALNNSWDVVSLDHDLGGEQYVSSERDDTGMGVVRWIAKNKPAVGRFIVHSHNHIGAENMESLLRTTGYNVKQIPFSNLIKQFN
jgi:hypothetical protein